MATISAMPGPDEKNCTQNKRPQNKDCLMAINITYNIPTKVSRLMTKRQTDDCRGHSPQRLKNSRMCL